MRVLSTLVCIFIFLQLNAQTFRKNYILGEDRRQMGHDVHILDDGYMVLGTGTCDSMLCTFILRLDKEGDTLWSKQYTEFFGHTRHTTISDSILYMPGEYFDLEGNFDRTGYRLFRFDLNGDTIDSRKYDLSQLENPLADSIRRYAPHGCEIYGDKIVVYGEVYEHDTGLTDVFSRGLMVWYNKDLSYDTMMLLQPRYEEFAIWDVKIGPDGLLTLMVDDDILVNSVEEHYRYFMKYDSHGNRVWSSEPFLIDDPRWFFMSSAILPNEDMIMYYQNDTITSRFSRALVSYGPDGVINWKRRLDPIRNVDFREIYEIAAAQDGHILVSGTYEDQAFYRSGVYLAKYNQNNGDLIWERVYQDWTELGQGGAPASANAWRIKVEDDGSLILVGESKKEIPGDFFDRDILLMRTDSEGCLWQDCGGFEQNIAGTQKYYPIFYEGDLWYHQDKEAREGIFKLKYNEISIGEEDVFLLVRGDILLGATEGGFGATDIRFKLREEARKVFFRLGDEDLLLYDFTLNFGDIFSSDYVAQDLEVIESDTILLLNGAKRRTWTLACMENPENTITWIEQIGTDYGVLWPRDFCSGDYGDVRLTCYYRFEQLHYINEDIGGCFLSSTFDPESTLLADISVHPNPTQDHLTISAPDDLHITRTELLNLHGRTHTRFHEHTSEVQLDLSSYPSGLYFVSIHTDKGAVVKKVVVE